MKFFFFTLLLISFPFAAVGEPSGESRPANAGDFFRQPQSGAKNYNESWDYVFVLDNGAKAYVNYSWFNMPNSGYKIGTQFSIWNFLGKSANVGRQYPTERFKEDKSTNTINIKDEYLMEKMPGKGHRVLFTADKHGKYFLDLTFTSAQAAQIPGNGVFSVDGQKCGLYVLIPYGRVEGRIGINGDTIAVKGYGYMDHIWQTEVASNMAARSLLFTGSNENRMAGRINISPKGEAYGYALSSKIPTAILPENVLEGASAYNPKKFPGQLTINWKNPDASPLKFEAKAQERFSILSNAEGFMERQLMKSAMGEIFHLRGRSQTESHGRIDWVMYGK